MFSNISWQEYWIFLALSTSLYYLLIYILYFRAVTTMSFQQKQASANAGLNEKEPSPTLFDQHSSMEENPGMVHACMDELNAFFDNQKKTKALKSEILFALQGILQKYPSLRKSDYKEALTNVIATQCENICSIPLSAEELRGVWLG